MHFIEQKVNPFLFQPQQVHLNEIKCYQITRRVSKSRNNMSLESCITNSQAYIFIRIYSYTVPVNVFEHMFIRRIKSIKRTGFSFQLVSFLIILIHQRISISADVHSRAYCVHSSLIFCSDYHTLQVIHMQYLSYHNILMHTVFSCVCELQKHNNCNLQASHHIFENPQINCK